MAKRIIFLSGHEGNAYVLLGITKDMLEQLGKTKEEIKKVIDDMESSDYSHLTSTMYKNLKDYIEFR